MDTKDKLISVKQQEYEGLILLLESMRRTIRGAKPCWACGRENNCIAHERERCRLSGGAYFNYDEKCFSEETDNYGVPF